MSYSPLTLPWRMIRLIGRFAVPLALWYTVGQTLRYALFYVGYRFVHNAVVPIIVLGLVVVVTVATTVAMVHCVKDGLPTIKKRDLDESLASWAADEDEGIARAVGRAVFPFMIFYLAWGWFGKDAQAFAQSAAGRGYAQNGLGSQLDGMKMLLLLQDHLYIAIAATVLFFILKDLSERFLFPRLPSVGGLLIAFCEVNWTLFGLFTVEQLRGGAVGWITDRQAWGWLGSVLGDVFALWPYFKDGVLASLIWLVIAGLILGVDAEDEEKILGAHRVMRGMARASGIYQPHTPREVLTRELREKWLPAIYGFRLVFRAGGLSFAVFCVLYTALDPLGDLAKRGVYRLLGPHPVPWWNVRLTPIDLGVGLAQEMVRVCLLAAAFELVVARVNARTAPSHPARAAAPGSPAAPVRPPWPPAAEPPR
ncbi:hypothetical protein NE235_03005 [Actinoallomurus spadix]|uniref:Transmembrane protein n=1 Tax=Actinoallomurus spadix TaxID=79912 RepID=A0ABP3HFY8_9ACTN|nr:hypothetical protein [Actinoallomurus spadix]MCO5985073.1 hypothetical protein [Actinoallomurus spadix]